MTTETETASGAAVEKVAPVTAETPVIAGPEATSDAGEQANSESAKPEKTVEQKEIERLRRQLNKRDKTQYQMHLEREQLARELEQYRSRSQTPQEDQQQSIRPEDVERLAAQRAQDIAQAREMQKAVNTVLEQGKSIAAFDDLCNTVNEEVPFYDAKQRPTPFLEAVLDSDKPHELLAYLGQNPDMAAELNGLSAARLGRRIEAIEREMKASKVSKAPAPIKPVTPKGSPVPKNPADMTDAEWYAQRRKR